MAPIGLTLRINEAVANIDAGRKGFAHIGQERAGRILYEKGIAKALSLFKEAQLSADPKTLIFAEYTFILQELHLCNTSDADTYNSLTKAIQFFDDAFLALNIVDETSLYHVAEKTYPHDTQYRVSGFPKDSFHIACISHKTRLQNILRSPGIDLIEKALLKQRRVNLTTAQHGYVEKQKTSMLRD